MITKHIIESFFQFHSLIFWFFILQILFSLGLVVSVDAPIDDNAKRYYKYSKNEKQYADSSFSSGLCHVGVELKAFLLNAQAHHALFLGETDI